MKLVFAGLETPITLEPGECALLQVENPALFARLVLSLKAGEELGAAEPYSFWEDDARVKHKDALMLADNPLDLPWDDRTFMSAIVKRVEREFLEDEDLRKEIEAAQLALLQELQVFGMGFNAEFGFGAEWDLKRYLKFLGFGVTYEGNKSLLDNLLNFLSFALDAGCKKTIAFVNLKTFLTETEIQAFYEHVFFLKMRVLLLENKRDEACYEHERKTVVDLHFLEY